MEEVVAGRRASLVRAGEVVPVDGAVVSDEAVLDESALTGEPLPVVRGPGAPVRSGARNAGRPPSRCAPRGRRPRAPTPRSCGWSRQAEAAAGALRAHGRPLRGRLPAGHARRSPALAWAASGDRVRALAVLVVATPCPLILAAPIALISGVSRAARAGVIVKGARAIEQLGRARTVLLDKTGTLTDGRARGASACRRSTAIAERRAAAPGRLASSSCRRTSLAGALVRGARRARGLAARAAGRGPEEPGRGHRGPRGRPRASPPAAAALAPRRGATTARPRAARHRRPSRPRCSWGVDGRLAGVDRDGGPAAARRAATRARGCGAAGVATSRS